MSAQEYEEVYDRRRAAGRKHATHFISDKSENGKNDYISFYIIETKEMCDKTMSTYPAYLDCWGCFSRHSNHDMEAELLERLRPISEYEGEL